jgi:hypothetical protein
MNIQTVHGREATLALAESIAGTRTNGVLFVPGTGREQGYLHHGKLPEGVTYRDEAGRVYDGHRGIMGFRPRVIDAAGLLALSFANYPGTPGGSHVETPEDGGEPTTDLMAPNPDDFEGKEGPLHIVDAGGFHPFGPGRENTRLYTATERIAILGTGILSVRDLALPIRQVADPATAHYEDRIA